MSRSPRPTRRPRGRSPRGAALVGGAALALVLTVAACTPAPSADPTPADPSPADPSVAASSSAPAPSASTPAPSASASTSTAAVTIDIVIAGGQVTPNAEKIDIARGTTVNLTVRSDTDDEIHAHTAGDGYELEVTAGRPATGSFVASDTGSFEIESHGLDKVIAILQVR